MLACPHSYLASRCAHRCIIAHTPSSSISISKAPHQRQDATRFVSATTEHIINASSRKDNRDAASSALACMNEDFASSPSAFQPSFAIASHHIIFYQAYSLSKSSFWAILAPPGFTIIQHFCRHYYPSQQIYLVVCSPPMLLLLHFSLFFARFHTHHSLHSNARIHHFFYSHAN